MGKCAFTLLTTSCREQHWFFDGPLPPLNCSAATLSLTVKAESCALLRYLPPSLSFYTVHLYQPSSPLCNLSMSISWSALSTPSLPTCAFTIQTHPVPTWINQLLLLCSVASFELLFTYCAILFFSREAENYYQFVRTDPNVLSNCIGPTQEWCKNSIFNFFKPSGWKEEFNLQIVLCLVIRSLWWDGTSLTKSWRPVTRLASFLYGSATRDAGPLNSSTIATLP